MNPTSSQSSSPKFVFHDLRGKRWSRLKKLLVAGTLLSLLGAILMLHFLLIRPELQLPDSVKTLHSQLHALKKAKILRAPSPRRDKSPGPRHSPLKPQRAKASPSFSRNPDPAPKAVFAFYHDEDLSAWTSLEKNAAEITYLSPSWLSLIDEELHVDLQFSEKVENLASSHGIKIVPQLHNFFEGWRDDLIESLIVAPVQDQNAFIDHIVTLLKQRHYDGITLDFEEVAPEYSQPFNDFLIHFADACHSQKLQFFLCIPVGFDSEVFDLDLLALHVDYFIGMLYDENSRHDRPGPIASQPWFMRWLKRLLEFGDAHQWIIALGTFGYDWSSTSVAGKEIGFAEAMSLARHAGLETLEMSTPELHPTFAYHDETSNHEVWFLDSVTFYNQVRQIDTANCAGIGIDRLGLEDPGIWTVLRQSSQLPTSKFDTTFLDTLESGDQIVHHGEGEFVRVVEFPGRGKRTFHRTPQGELIETYTAFPGGLELYHFGETRPQWIALTFDDGPDPKWTPQILQILKQEAIHATFFLVGSQIEKYPYLVRRILDDGHEIGNHSYSHPNLTSIPGIQVDLELNATQRLIESITGQSTVLFRPPYFADSYPRSSAEILPILRAQNLGYVTLCENIDPEDWTQPGAHVLTQRILHQRPYGNVVLLHDGGGNRSQTVEALPEIISALRKSSDGNIRFVTASELLGLTRSQVMPRVPPSDRNIIVASHFSLETLYWGEELFWTVMMVLSLLIILRSGTMSGLSFFQFLRTRKHPRMQKDPSAFSPPISVLLAAYNEEKTISKTLRSILDSTYPGPFEILVVDDGSTDATAQIIETTFAHEPRIRIVRQDNYGKSVALQHASREAQYEIFVTIDADTQITTQTLSELIAPFQDPRLGAVSGNARVGNPSPWLTRFQSLEYICGFNLDRRAYDLLNCIPVVPGAIGAFRKTAWDRAGGLTSDTLAEDTDLTLQIRKDGWRIRYQDRAIAWTEAPQTLSHLVRQRFRWTFGTLQSLWKHRDAIFDPKHGTLAWVALPSLWVFQIGMVALAPLVDLMVCLALMGGHTQLVGADFGVFLSLDVLLALLALFMEGEALRNAWLILPQRLLYRPLLAWVVWQSIVKALQGAWVGWGKFERTASVNLTSSSKSTLNL